MRRVAPAIPLNEAEARYAREHGQDALDRQRQEADRRLLCCGELKSEGHHRECSLWKPPHVDGQESLL